tara:strand:- start:167327 stop:167446 length:120 start_codon:yes stop_codon:yes gene_type:complete
LEESERLLMLEETALLVRPERSVLLAAANSKTDWRCFEW